MLKKILFLIVGFIYSTTYVLAVENNSSNNTIKDSILPSGNSNVSFSQKEAFGSEGSVFSILSYVKDTIFGLLMVVAVGAFLYLGFKLVIARGNPEEFKKTLTMFIYSIVGIVLVSLAQAIVTIVAGLQF